MADIMSCITEPAKVVGKWIGQQIFQQLTFLWCFTTNINSLRDEAKMLDNATKGLQLDVDKARDNGDVIDPEVETWLEKSKAIKDETSKILSEATNVESDHLKLGDRLSLSKRAKEMTDRAKDFRYHKKINDISHSIPRGRTFEWEPRNKIEEEIMTTLRGGDVNMIGICGMSGLGKTTMAKKIMSRVLEEHVFEEVVIANVNHNVDISKIQDEIGGQLLLEKLKEEKSEPARVNILQSRLSDEKRILLVLDDVWERLVLEDFGIPRESKGCTILLTSRNSDVLSAMRVQIFGMEELSKEDAWCFFRDGAGTCVDNVDLNSIAREVAKECRGLPIALTSVSEVLKDEDDVSIWEDALRQLIHCDPDIPELITEVYNPLKLSYDCLTQEEKSIFLLCCLFPEDANIPLEYLTYFCMGLRIFEEDITNMEDARKKTRALTKMLKSRCLLLDSDKEDCVRMHDVVRDVCTFIAKEEGYIGKDGCTWISSSHLVGERNKLLSGSRCPNMDLLFLDSTYDDSLGFKFDDAFLEGIRELYVLCIERYSLTTLLHPTQSLGKLNTLILDSCEELETISVVGELVNLEILICRNCGSIEKLPLEMKGLNCLKVLELTGCKNLQSIGRGIISNLVGLEELKMLDSFNQWEVEDIEERENAALTELEALTNLAGLEIDIRDHSLIAENMPLLSKKIARFIIRTIRFALPSKFSKAMSLWFGRETRLGDWIEMHFLRDTECLYLSGVGASNVDLAKSENIRWLELKECKTMKNVVRTSRGDDATVFPLIEHLILLSLPELREICDGPISSCSFQNLKELQLRYLKALTQFWKSNRVCKTNYIPHFSNLSSIDICKCNSLRSLGQLSMAGKDCLPQLQQLFIKKCEMMEQVFLWNDIGEADGNKTGVESQRDISRCNVITKVFPKLKEVELYDLRNLTTFYQGIQGIEFPLLMKMKIEICPKMKSIIGNNRANIDDEDGSSHLLCQPQKESFGCLEVLEINNNPLCSHEIPSSLFDGLKDLSINKYVGTMSIFTLSVAANLVSLTKLHISNCDEMIKVIEDEQQQERRILVFPKLKTLELKNLPKSVTFCNSKCEVEFPSLNEVVICTCPNMENFSLGLVAAPKLEAFRTDLTTYVGVGVDVSFDSLKLLMIYAANENPFYDDKISVSIFNGMEKLIFEEYKGGSMSLFLSSAIGSLVNLKVLEIGKCMELVKIIEDEEEKEDGKVESGGEIRIVVFPKLEELTLHDLPNLVSLCEWKCNIELPSLTTLEIRWCLYMKSFSMGSVAAPNLKIVRLDEEEIDATKDLNEALQQHYLARENEVNDLAYQRYRPFIPWDLYDYIEGRSS